VKIVITGSEGNVGRRLMAAFPGAIGVDRSPAAAVSIDFDTADFRAEPMRGVLSGADAVIHLGAEPRPQAPDAVHWQSVINAARLAAAAAEADVPRFVIASSGWAVPMEGQWLNAYAHSKRVAESLAAMYDNRAGCRGRAVRIGWVPPRAEARLTAEPWLAALYWDDERLIREFKEALGPL
jgi:nucleoside-diphosphate-sugar epimerase